LDEDKEKEKLEKVKEKEVSPVTSFNLWPLLRDVHLSLSIFISLSLSLSLSLFGILHTRI
jgi:hypothetical protein